MSFQGQLGQAEAASQQLKLDLTTASQQLASREDDLAKLQQQLQERQEQVEKMEVKIAEKEAKVGYSYPYRFLSAAMASVTRRALEKLYATEYHQSSTLHAH